MEQNMEYKFKARDRKAGEWVFFTLEELLKKNVVDTNLNIDCSTICQFTGVVDCFGEEIYTNDIVSRHRPHDGSINPFLVTWNESAFGKDVSITPARLLVLATSHEDYAAISNRFDDIFCDFNVSKPISRKATWLSIGRNIIFEGDVIEFKEDICDLFTNNQKFYKGEKFVCKNIDGYKLTELKGERRAVIRNDYIARIELPAKIVGVKFAK